MSRFTSRLLVAGLMLMMGTAPGCSGMRNLASRGGFAAAPRCVLPENPSVEQVVQHINTNVDKIHGWQASSVKIRAQSVPIPLSGNLVVERDHRLRLEVTSVAGKEVDLGSNDQIFWIWTKPRGQQPPAVYYAAHADMDVARQQMPIPFEPDWLMEALGVVPLSSENTTMDSAPGSASIRLVSHHEMPDGQQVKKVVVVDTCRGHIMEHCTYSAGGQLMVRALLQSYKVDPVSGANLPRHIKLDWPQAEMSLAMDLGHVDVNPPGVPTAVWTMPTMPGHQMVNLGDSRLTGQQYASRRAPTRENAPSAPNGQRQNSPRPTMIASGAETLDPSFLPPMSSPTHDDLDDEEPSEFEPPKLTPAGGTRPSEPDVSELPELMFEPIPAEEEAGRATLESPPQTEAF